MKVMAIIASVIMIIVPTISLAMSIIAGKKKALKKQMFYVGEVIPSVLMWLATMAIYFFAGIFKNFGL